MAKKERGRGFACMRKRSALFAGKKGNVASIY
jgi:hypothetical protein